MRPVRNLSFLLLATLLAAGTERPAAQATIPPGWPPSWLPTFGEKPCPGSGTVRAFAVFDDGAGPALYLGGDFKTAGTQDALRVVKWDGAAWTPLGAGLNGSVLALAVYDDGGGPALHAGGMFTEAGGMPAANVARWDGTSWSPLGAGVDDSVAALAVYDDGQGPALYAGGGFQTAGGGPASSIAKWNGVSWSPVGGGADNYVSCLEVFDDGGGPALVAGGWFASVGGIAASRIARWDGSAWSALGAGIAGYLHTLGVYDDGGGAALYAGGNFSSAGAAPANNVARWDGTAWSPLGAGTACGDDVRSLCVHDDGSGPVLLVGGEFNSAAGGACYGPTRFLVRWDGQALSTMPELPLGSVFAMASYDEGAGPVLFAGGNMGTSSGHWVGLQRWDGAAWTVLGDGLNGGVLDIAVFDDGGGPALYAGGGFTLAGGSEMDRIARWDGADWSPLAGGMNSTVSSLAVFDDGGGPALYAGGWFTHAGGAPANRIAKWDGASWSALGEGLQPPWIGGVVETLCVFNDGGGAALYAGGFFSKSGAVPLSNVARWDGTSWSPVGTGIDGSGLVSALTVFDDGSGPALYAGGSFTSAGGVPTEHVARWDGTSWTPVGGGTDSLSVYALAVHDDGSGPALYAGGAFQTAGGVPASGVARWDGASWSAVGGGITVVGYYDGVSALSVVDDGGGPALYAGGVFALASGQPASNVAKWDGASWSALGAGMNGGVDCFTAFDDGTGPALFAGGAFKKALDSGDSFLAKWGAPAIVTVPGCYGNPATLSALAKAAKIGQPFPLQLEAGAIPTGTALLFLGPDGVDAAGCGVFVPGFGEFLIGFSPALLAQAPMSVGVAAFPLVVPATPALVGLTPHLAAVTVGPLPAVSIEM